MNGISFQMPTSPLLGRLNLNGLNLCNINNLPANCINATACLCTHLITVRANSVVDFVLIDESNGIRIFQNRTLSFHNSNTLNKKINK